MCPLAVIKLLKILCEHQCMPLHTKSCSAEGNLVQEPADVLGSFSWTKQWYPVAIVEDLDESKPTPVNLFGKSLVLWRDAAAQWKCFADTCPHRLHVCLHCIHRKMTISTCKKVYCGPCDAPLFEIAIYQCCIRSLITWLSSTVMACHYLSDHRPQCYSGLRRSLRAGLQKMVRCSAHIMAGSLTLRVPAPVCPRLRALSRPTRLQLTPEPVPLYIQARSVCSLYSQSCTTNTYLSYPCHTRVCKHTHM